MESNITSNAADLPKSCRATMDHMVSEIEKEDKCSEFANISSACNEKLTEWEAELKKQGHSNIALVAYQLGESNYD